MCGTAVPLCYGITTGTVSQHPDPFSRGRIAPIRHRQPLAAAREHADGCAHSRLNQNRTLALRRRKDQRRVDEGEPLDEE